MPEMGQIGLFEVEYLISYLTWDQSGPRCSTSKNAVTSGFRSFKVIEKTLLIDRMRVSVDLLL